MRVEGWQTQNTASNCHKIPRRISFKKSKPKPNSYTDRRRWNIHTTYVCSLSPAATATTTSSNSSWLYAAVDDDDEHPLHPLTFKPHPITLDLFKFHSFLLTSFNHTDDFPFDKIVLPPPKSTTADGGSIVVLHGGGRLLVAGQNSGKWVELSEDKFDDIIDFRGDTYVVDREGGLYVINNDVTSRKLRLGKMVAARPAPAPGTTGGAGWRKRFVEGVRQLYMVVRVEERVFRVYKLSEVGRACYCWREVDWFDDGEVVLFVSKECGFSLSEFVGREYEGFCLVFSEAGFHKYGDDGGWEYSCEDGFGVFRLCDESYGRVGESVDFPEIDWSPPSWVFDGREPDEDDEGVQSHLNDSNSKNEEDPEGMEEQEERSDSDIQDLEGGKIQHDSNSLEKEDEEMQSNTDNEGDTALQEGVPPSLFASVSAVEEEVTRTLLRMNGGNEPMAKESLRKHAMLSPPRACTSCSATKGYKSDFATAKFEGFDIRSDLVPTLQKIWRNHGNIIENSPMRSGDIIANALESLAIMVQILDNNSVQSLSDCQAEYLSSTLSDLKIMCFKVHWLVSSVEKAVKLHKSKPLVDSINKLDQLSSQVKERKAILVDELAKLTEEESKLKKEMAKVSKLIPFSGKVKFDEPFGSGLT